MTKIAGSRRKLPPLLDTQLFWAASERLVVHEQGGEHWIVEGWDGLRWIGVEWVGLERIGVESD